MGKKKGKGPGGSRRDPDDVPDEDDAEETPRALSGDAAAAATSSEGALPAPPLPEPVSKEAANDHATNADDGSEVMSMRDGMVVEGTKHTRHIASVPYCEGACARAFLFTRILKLFDLRAFGP
jgi:hypothetical protein